MCVCARALLQADNCVADCCAPAVWVAAADQNDLYPDIRNDYKQSEVATDYNAGFTGAAAGLAYFL